MANWGANHGSLTYGHIGRDLITVASMLRIPLPRTTCRTRAFTGHTLGPLLARQIWRARITGLVIVMGRCINNY